MCLYIVVNHPQGFFHGLKYWKIFLHERYQNQNIFKSLPLAGLYFFSIYVLWWTPNKLIRFICSKIWYKFNLFGFQCLPTWPWTSSLFLKVMFMDILFDQTKENLCIFFWGKKRNFSTSWEVQPEQIFELLFIFNTQN